MGKSKVSGSLVVCELHGCKKVWEYNNAKDEVVCTLCPHRFSVTGQVRFLAKTHAETAKHKKAVSNNAERQTFINNQKTEGTSAENGYFCDMVTAFVKANIALNKIELPDFGAFLEKHTGKSSLHESTPRKRRNHEGSSK